MNPTYCHASPVRTFVLSQGWETTLFENVVSTDLLRYHFLLAVQERGAERPVLWIASEWLASEPETYECPRLGLFVETGHLLVGSDPRWIDPILFLLKAVELARIQIGGPAAAAGEPEIWASAQIWPHLRQRPREVGDPERLAHYRKAIAHCRHLTHPQVLRVAGL